MLCREIIAVCSQIHTKHINTQCGHNVMFPIMNVLKQGDALSAFLFNFVLENAIRTVQVKQDGLKLNGTHQLLAYADDVNVLALRCYCTGITQLMY